MKTFACISAIAITQLVGCASIVNGQNQSISIETRLDKNLTLVSGATCRLSNNKGTWFVTTPGSTTVQRSYEDLSVACEKETHEPGLASVKSSTKAMAFGNIIFGGIIGAGVDMGTGAAYDYPSLISVIMGKTTMIGTPPNSAVKDPADATTTEAPSTSTPVTSAEIKTTAM